MVGSSIWLCPYEGSELDEKLSKLINVTIPPRFAAHETVPKFRPHITITSEVPPELDPKEVIDGIEITETLEVVLEKFVIGQTFFTRGTLHAAHTPSLDAFALQCRKKYVPGGQTPGEAEQWLKETFTPHLSLVYANVSPVPEDIVKGVEKDIVDAGIELGSTGWNGGKIMVVSTSKPIDEWVTLAEREICGE